MQLCACSWAFMYTHGVPLGLGLQGGCMLGEGHVVAITTMQMEVRQLKRPSTNDITM